MKLQDKYYNGFKIDTIKSSLETNNCEGIFVIRRELRSEEFDKLLNSLVKITKGIIGLVDKKNREIPKLTRIEVTSDLYVGNNPLLKKKPNIIVFRDNVTEQNIVEIIDMILAGYKVLVFTNLTKSELIKLYCDSENKTSLSLATKIFDLIDLIEIGGN